MDLLILLWTLCLVHHPSNCGENENLKNNNSETEQKVDKCREVQTSASSKNQSVEKLGEPSREKKLKIAKLQTKNSSKGALNGTRNSSVPDEPIVAYLNNSKEEAKLKVLSNAIFADKETKSKPNREELKSKESHITRIKKTEKSEDTKKYLNEKRSDNASIRIPEKTSVKINHQMPILNCIQSTSDPTRTGQSSVRLNPNAPLFKPPTNAQVISPNVATSQPGQSANSKKLALNPNAPTFQPKIHPLIREMSLLSERMRKIEPNFPVFKKITSFSRYLIVTYDCLHPRSDESSHEDPSVITSISIYESETGEQVYKAYPEIGKISNLSAYRNAEILDEASPEKRKDVATIGKEITKIVNRRVIVGINLGKIIHPYKIYVKPLYVREITSLAKYSDIISSRSDNIGKHSLWFRNHKGLLGTFLPEMREELRPLPIFFGADKKKYISILFEKLRQDWESEVEFLKRLYWHYRPRPESELLNLMKQFGPLYPGLHSDKPFFFDKAISLPKELVGLHIRYDKWNKAITSITALDYKLDRLFKAFVRDTNHVKLDSHGGVTGRLESIRNYIIENNFFGGNAMIVGFDVYKMMRILDSEKKFKGARIYDTKIIFDAETVTEMAIKYLKIDYRPRFLINYSNVSGNARLELESFNVCDHKLPIEFAAKISLQMFRLYSLDKNSKVQALKLWE